MKKYKSLHVTGILVLSLATLMAGCGGGGGDTSRSGGTDATLTEANAAQVSDMVIQATKLIAPSAAFGDLKTSGVSPSDRPPLLSILENALSISGSGADSKHVSDISSFNENCAGDGSISVNIDVGGIDPFNKIIPVDIDISQCKIGTQTLNGSMHVDYEMNSMDVLTNPTVENLKDFKKITVRTTDPSGITYVNLSNGDNVALKELTLVLENFVYNGDVLTGGTVTMGGIVVGTVGDEPIDVECDSYRVTFMSDSTGINIWISGRIRAQCLGGWITISTSTPMFFPSNSSCPTNGEIIITASGSTMIIDIGPNSAAITVYLDGNVIDTYTDCSEVRGFCSQG
jgi:hypothetical protein